MKADRAEILARIDEASGPATAACEREYASIPRAYRQLAERERQAIVDLFLSRIEQYDGGIRRCSVDRIAAAVAETLSGRGLQRIVAADGLPEAWLPVGYRFAQESLLSNHELDAVEGVVTTCTVAIALTGTIVLTHGDGEGRRALTLVPDYQLCIVPADAIVETVPEAIRLLAQSRPRVVTTISGPSATADIEMNRVKGVHGPRTLDVIVAG